MAILGFKGERGYSAYEIAVQHGFVGTEETWLAQLGTSSGYKQDSVVHVTSGAGESRFSLPSTYSSLSTIDVYVDGVKLTAEDYTIDSKTKTVTLNTPIQKVGANVEIITTTATVTNLPLVNELNSSSTENTAPSAKCVYDVKVKIDSDIKKANDTINKVKVPAGGKTGQVLTKTNNNDNEVKWETLDWLNKIYPVGSIYMNVSLVDPAQLFGGTWQRIQDRFLLSAGSSYTAGKTGGEASHTLTPSEMPKHDHAGAFTYNSTWKIGNRTGSSLAGDNAIYICPTQSGGAANIVPPSAGGGQSHNNMPPYLTVYMWKRTA